jgi:spermidine/putrescine transport system substrate-binding protein
VNPRGQPPGISRRSFLGRAAGAGAAASGLGTLLTSCGLGSATPKRFSPLPDPKHPVLWPITTANQPIAGGQRPETNATLKIYGWTGRISHRCLRDFSRAYRCRVELTTYSSMTQALARVSHGGDRFDVFMGAPTYLIGILVGRSVIQPLNHRYIPNISEAWPVFTDPYYDSHWQYTVPYTAYTTGIAWRKDHVDIDPYALRNGWEFPWLAKAVGKTAILNDYRESIGLGLLKNFVTDINCTDPFPINKARDALLSLDDLVGLKFTNNVAGQLASTQSWIQLARSGQAAAAAKRLPPGVPVDVIGYWFPPSGAGPVASDTNTVLRGARNPVLAHLFLNFMLDRHNAMRNMAATGFTMPLTYASVARQIDAGILPPSLTSAVVTATYWDHGFKEFQLLPAVDMLWRQAWQAVRRDSSAAGS